MTRNTDDTKVANTRNVKNGETNKGRNVKHGSNADGDEVTKHSCDEATELAGHGRYNQFMLITCCVLSNAVGIDMSGFGIIVTAASCDLKLGIVETGILASAPFSGLLFACPLGYITDLYGRRRVMLISMIICFLFSTISSLSPTWQVMMGVRLVSCCFSMSAINIFTYLGECTTNKYRSRYIFIQNSFNLASQLAAFVLAYFVLSLDFNYPVTFLTITFRPWRLLTLIMSLPLGIGSLMLYFLYESPKYLAHTGKKDEALKILKSVYKINGNGHDFPVKALASASNDMDFSLGFWKTFANQVGPIFKKPLLWRSLQLFYMVSVCCSTAFVFIMWFPKMVNSFFNSFAEGNATQVQGFCERVISNINNESKNTTSTICDDKVANYTIYSGMIYGLFFMTLNLIAASLAKYRRSVIVCIFLISAISAILVDAVKQPIVNIIAFTLLQSTSICIGAIFCYFIDLYPTSSRSFGTSLAMTISRLLCFAGTNLVGAVISDYCSLTFYCWSAFILTGVGVALLLPSDKQIKKLVSASPS